MFLLHEEQSLFKWWTLAHVHVAFYSSKEGLWHFTVRKAGPSSGFEEQKQPKSVGITEKPVGGLEPTFRKCVCKKTQITAMFTHRTKTTWTFNASPPLWWNTFNTCLYRKRCRKEQKTVRDGTVVESTSGEAALGGSAGCVPHQLCGFRQVTYAIYLFGLHEIWIEVPIWWDIST